MLINREYVIKILTKMEENLLVFKDLLHQTHDHGPDSWICLTIFYMLDKAGN